MAAKIIDQPSRTFYEYLLEPNETTEHCTPDKISLRAPVVKHKLGEESAFYLNMPFTSAIMQSVSGPKIAIELALNGGLSFIFHSQLIEKQAEMIREVKLYKAGFVESDSNLPPTATLEDAISLTQKTGHSTIAITVNGEKNGRLLGIITDKDYWIEDRMNRPDETVKALMTTIDSLVLGKEGISPEEAAQLLWKHKKSCLPIVDNNGRLVSLVFRKDYETHKEHPLELIDDNRRLCVGAGLNTHDYLERIPELIKSGADIFCFDSSDGYSVYQKRAIQKLKEKNPGIIVGGGNVVNEEGFRYLVDGGADFIKVGIGGGSICITRDQKGIGKGQATAVMDIAAARDKYLEETGIYIPICADGGISSDYHITLALAFGADFVMMGRYFAAFEESPTPVTVINGKRFKPYWGEGTNRAQNWQRYYLGEAAAERLFEEGVDGFVPYAGRLRDTLPATIAKVKSTMSNCGCADIKELHEKAVIRRVSEATLKEGKAHDVILPSSGTYSAHNW